MLYIVATPIGNLEDITLRALRVLKEADLIAAEDTRHTRKLLNRYEIKTKLVSFHEHSDAGKIDWLINKLVCGNDIALVSDAGTPLISDPGARLVGKAVENGVPVTSVPGACAAITALAIGGITGPFCFLGFLPKKASDKSAQIKRIAESDMVCVIYESPHALAGTLSALCDSAGAERRIVVAKELTKLHESVFRGNLKGAQEAFKEGVKGEYVLIVDKKDEVKTMPDDESIVKEINKLLKEGMTKKDAARAASANLGVSKNKAYSLIPE
ncbi:MAG: 16S rRNA (cytidine(1402)-2'-O)-methyltransferase [Christensenellales bacterium]